MRLDKLYADRLLREFEALIHRTLADLNIRKCHGDYQDYAQELRLKLLDVVDRFEGDPLAEDRYRFVAYAGRYLRWSLLDLLRQTSRLPQLTLSDHQDWLTESESAEDFEAGAADFLQAAQDTLSERDYQLTLALAEGDFSIADIARTFGVARKTIYQWKDRLAQRLLPFKDLLED
ncbi:MULTISPECIES: sigma-70 family RNA polymerase sigma factor [Aerococcus]|uniref:Sigma-70 family RNA polymerase sigma factor n=1 Tax=Aerococcus mictus TaxID=2976810 RepID=A0ABZ2ECJ1_9LACT|nr:MULTISPECIES: sigma-70 family RNA polymerase sigma factor [Aerococcus]AEA01901.1 RNA polymerase sigma factor, sigma-70 family [Aerococcus sp. Group 1]KAA9233723.1 sigma-70 family RNA polymerase sigma factor [Aerococcus mictus]KAA9290048.1 sigma-70 family RNA polymerase sigma factor [Aerococcus mictus]MBU5610884.1 sigma-70 family RNA polymerase sigma factor [Aerococcus urinae]MCY3062740.1 sigma-70 family RNA polymerase sigma factor [Aerococcus sp. Group 1]